MTQYETKCLDIFNLIRKMPEHTHEESHRYFKNLEKYNIQYRLADGTTKILSYVHFNVYRTDFLPDGKLYWKKLAKGEYKKVVNSLLKALSEANHSKE